MAETKRMTADEVVSYLLEEDGVDFLRESLRWVVQELMEAEVSELIGAEHGERSEERLTHRNGYRPRPGRRREQSRSARRSTNGTSATGTSRRSRDAGCRRSRRAMSGG
jgi:transposase-like protein